MTPRPSTAAPRVAAGDLGLVALGGAVGTAARYVTSALLPVPGLPLVTLLINVVGAFLLGLLLELLGRLPATRAVVAERLRLLLGTGVLGGFTTYSALAVDTVTAGSAVASVLYAAGTLVLGLAAAAAGMTLGRRRP